MTFAVMVEGTPNPIHVDAVKKALLKLASEAANDPGNIRYEFYQPDSEPTQFVLIALWEKEEDWKAHAVSETHDRYLASLPENAWAIPPVATRMHLLEEVP